MVGERRTGKRENGRWEKEPGKNEENEHSGKERVTRIGDRTFLDMKDREGERNRKRRSDVVRKSEWDYRGARKCGRATVSLRADREGDIDRPCAGWSRQRYGQRKRKRENGDAMKKENDRERGRGRKRARWIGEGRRQPARRMPLLAAVRF